MIERRNILDLIGRHRGKYHSCILTCYNFDFSFFEERVLPVLRTANIKNVNILADGNFLEQAQEMTTGREFKYNNTYNFLPVYKKGVFHPKIMLLTGLKHGLLIIGSGNITSSGLSTNDEIWGAFHLDNTGNENAPLFASAWAYFQSYISNAFGFLPQKFEWMKKYSPWLEVLPRSEDNVLLASLKQNIRFISDGADLSIYQQLISILPARNLKTLTLISPYYDKSGNVLKQLMADFNPAMFNCLVDTNSGLLPTDLSSEYTNRINFYDWKDCINDYKHEVNRLHAKMIHFIYGDGSEFLFLGSANASLAAFGNEYIKGTNAEAGILINRKVSGNWIRELKIKLPKKEVNIKDYSNIPGLDSSGIIKTKLPCKIFYSELKGAEITCYVNEVPAYPLSLTLMTRQNLISETVHTIPHQNLITARVSDANEVFKVYLVNSEGERVSNYSIVHRFEMLLRGNPDPSQERFDSLLEQEFSEEDDLTSLLDFIDYDWADDDESNAEINQGAGRRPVVFSEKKEDKIYQKLSKDEFNKVTRDVFLRQAGLLTSRNVKLADFLSLLLSSSGGDEADFSESEEQKLLEDTEQMGEGDKVQSKGKTKADAEKEKRALIRYFNKLDRLYTDKLVEFYDDPVLTASPKEQITIKSISKILIALQLIHRYHGKKYLVTEDTNEGIAQVEGKYLVDGGIYDGPSSVKSFLINVFGKFLLLATAGVKKYDYTILNEKVDSYRKQLVDRVLCLIFNLTWRGDDEIGHRLTLLLNLHYFIEHCEGIDEEWRGNILKRVESFKKLNSSTPFFTENLKYYSGIFLPTYTTWVSILNGPEKNQLIKDLSSLNYGDIIFNRKIGFNQIERVVRGNTFFLNLKREGFPLNDDGYIIEHLAFGNKCVRYQ